MAQTPAPQGPAPTGMRWSKNQGKYIPVKPGGGKPNKPAPTTPQFNPNNAVNEGAQQWNDYARGMAERAENYGQNNPYSNAAQPYIENVLSGSMSQNPWEEGLYEDLRDQNLNETNDLLRKFIGGGKGGGGGQVEPGQKVHYGTVNAAYSQNPSGGTGAAGQVPDTVGGNSSFFAERIRDLFDPSRLDPMNDPAMAPYLAALRKENQENFYGNIQDLTAQAEGAGRYGSGLYQAMTGRAREESMESLDQQMAQQMMAARNNALEQQMQGLGLTNQRDLGAMQDATQRYGIDASASAAGAGAGAAAAAQAKAQELQAIGMLMGNAQFGMGQRGDMAGLMQQGQLGALGAGQGYAGLGLQGMNTGLDAGSLGLGSLGLISNNNLGNLNAENARRSVGVQRYGIQVQDRANRDNAMQNQFNSYLQLMMGIGGMGGSQMQQGAGTYIPSMNPYAAGIMGGLGTWNGTNGGQ